MPYGFNEDKSIFNLDSLIGSMATIETSPATANHAKGSYIVYDSQLYKVTQAIASGESLVVGTNISATNAGTELNALNNDLPKFINVTVSMASLTFEARGEWLRANVSLSDVLAGTGVSPQRIVFVQTILWSGTGKPVLSQFDSSGTILQLIASSAPTSSGSVILRFMYI